MSLQSVFFEQVKMTSSDSSSSIRVISSPGSGGASRSDPEVGSSGASSGPPSPVDARVLRDLEVMKADHDLDMAVTEGSLAMIRRRYSISVKFGLHVPQLRQRPYSSDAPDIVGVATLTARVGFRVSGAPSNNKGWKSRYLFVSGPVWGFRLDWLAHPIGNASPYLSEEEFVLVGRLKGILSSLCAIKEMTELWLVEAGLNPASRDRMDLDELRGMPKVSGGKAPSTRIAAQEVGVSPAREAPKASSKRPIDAPAEQVDDPARRHKKLKVLTRRHKSRHGEGESRSHSKDKKPAAPSKEPDTLVESDKRGVSPIHHRPRSMKDLFKTKVHKDDAGYYTMQMSDLGHQDLNKEMKAKWRGLKNSTKVWNDLSAAEEFERGLLHPQLARELYTLPSEVLLARAAKEMVLVSSQPLSRHRKFSFDRVLINCCSVQSQHLQMALFDRVHDVGRLITFMDYWISHLQQELDA
ncbi:hypothetical protein BHM03_00041376, partial [Ensete ventricosum]